MIDVGTRKNYVERRFRVPGTGYRVSGAGYRVASMSGSSTVVGAVAITPLAGKLRIISLRKANSKEAVRYGKTPEPQINR